MGVFDFGRKFINNLPFVGGAASSLWGDPNQEAHQEAYQQARRMLMQNRANMMDGRMNAMRQGSLAFGPRNEMLGQMMGQQTPALNLNPMLKNPMPSAMQTDIRDAAFGETPQDVLRRFKQQKFGG